MSKNVSNQKNKNHKHPYASMFLKKNVSENLKTIVFGL